MIYPGVIMSVAAIAISVLLIFVIPWVFLQNMFASVNPVLPLPTRVVIGMSAFLKGYWYLIIAAAVGGFYAFKKYYATPNGQLGGSTGSCFTRLFWGDVLRKSAVSRFTRTLGTLDQLRACRFSMVWKSRQKTAGNRVIQDAIMASRSSIAGGDTISAPLAKSNVFPPMVISMISVGEQTGGLDEMLAKIADFYDEEVDAAVSGLSFSLLEPVMIVFLGVVVGGMVVAMYLPIFDMVNAVQ